MNLQARYGTKRELISDVFQHRKLMNNHLASFAAYRGNGSLVRATNTQTMKTLHAFCGVWRPPFYVHAVSLDYAHGGMAGLHLRQIIAWSRRNFGTRIGRGWIVVPIYWPRKITEVVCYGIIISTDQQKIALAPLFLQDYV